VLVAPGQDRDRADLVARPLDRQRPREVLEPGAGGGVVGVAGRRGDQDDEPGRRWELVGADGVPGVVEGLLSSLGVRGRGADVDEDVDARDRAELREPLRDVGASACAAGDGDPDAGEEPRFENGEL
jgi:hypothetical protein